MKQNELLKQAMNELIPNGYYYNIKGRNINSAIKNPTKQQFKKLIKLTIFCNNEDFINTIKSKNETDFKKELDIQLSYYSGKTKDLTEWLNHTEKLIRKNITDRYLIRTLKEWLNIQHQLSAQTHSFDYKKHKLNFQIEFTPQNILKYYKEKNEFIYYNTETVKNIPVLKIANELEELQSKNNKGLQGTFLTAFDGYAEGFLTGFGTDFIGFIKTPENQKEWVLKALNINLTHGFPISVKNNYNKKPNISYYNKESFYEFGVKIGKNYKAWLLILENPSFYENDFPFTIITSKLQQTVLQFLKDELKKEYKEWIIELGNPLANEMQFLIRKKLECEAGIKKAHDMNAKLYHGKPSVLLYNETNFMAKLDIINDRIKQITPQQSVEIDKSIEPENPHPDIFVNGHVWEVFKKLIRVIVEPKPTKQKWANYSAIFQTLLEKKLVKKHHHKFLLDWCDTNYNTDFTSKDKFKSATSNHTTDLIKDYLIESNLIQKN